MELTVRELTVSASATGKDKEGASKVLLRDVSFHAAPKELVALMGPSGAGKTTLLNQLVGQGTRGLKSTGKIRFGDSTLQQSGALDDVRCKVGYVTQDDIMYECMTPRENLGFAARFLQAKVTAAKRAAAVDTVLEKLHLQKCADTVVGTPGLVKGISGGERKRTNVAMSLLGHPSLLLLDEPTSGLDAKMAYELMADLGSVAEQGCTIIATIHQPSDSCFQHFTKVLLLSAGQVAYFGPVTGLANRLSMLSFQMSERVPLPEMLLDILEAGSGDEAHAARLKSLLDASDPMPLGGEANGGTSGGTFGNTAQRLGFCGQLAVLTRRNLLHLRRSKDLTVVRTAQTIMSTVLIAWIFMQLPDDLTGVRSRLFATFMLGLAQLMFAMIGVVNTFPEERAVFLREAQDRWYNPVSYYMSKVMLDVAMQSFFPLLTTGIGYFLIGLNDSSVERVLLFYVIVTVMSNAGAAIGFIVSASVRSVAAGLSIAPGLVMPNFMLAGVFLPIQMLPEPFKAFSFLAFARYGLHALIFNEFTCDLHPDCGPAQRMLHGAACEHSKCNFCCSDADVLTTGGVCPVITCEDALAFLKMEVEDAWPTGDTPREAMLWNLVALVALTMLFRLLGLAALLIAYRRAVK